MIDNNENSAQQPENDISHLYVLSQAKMYVKANLDKLSENNVLNCAEEFLKTLTFSDNDRMSIEKATVGQHKNKTWHKMRHLLVTGKKIKSLYTRQKTLEKNPLTDVSLTVKHFIEQKEFQKSQVYPEAIEYGIKEEDSAKFCYSKVSEKQHCSFEFEEPGLIISRHYSWIGASLDGIRKCQCCDPTAVEMKCPFKGKDPDPKVAFLLPSVGGKKDKDGKYCLDENHIHYFQVQTGMAVSGLKTCDFVTYTSKGIFVVKINFNVNFWETVFATVYKFYCNQIVPSFLLEGFHSVNNHIKQ